MLIIEEPVFSFVKKKSLEQQGMRVSSKKVLQVQYQLPDDQFYGQGKSSKQISEQIKQQIRVMINNLPKLGKQERIPYQDVVFKNLQKIFDDHRQSLPGSFIKPLKLPKEKHGKGQRHRVSISIPLQTPKTQFQVEEQYYHNSDKNFEYDMKIVIKKIPNRPLMREHPLKKYLTGRLAEYEL